MTEHHVNSIVNISTVFEKRCLLKRNLMNDWMTMKQNSIPVCRPPIRIVAEAFLDTQQSNVIMRVPAC